LKIQWKTLILCIAIPLAVGGLSALFTADSMQSFQVQPQPPLSPPGWLFPIVWTILYALMGISAARIRLAPSSKQQQRAGNLFVAQLIVNFFWPLFFFNLQAFGFALLWLILLWVLVLLLIITSYQVDPVAAWLLIPYLVWLTFAAYLNAGVWLLN
jgi:tryptophan-rich sensory protein